MDTATLQAAGGEIKELEEAKAGTSPAFNDALVRCWIGRDGRCALAR